MQVDFYILSQQPLKVVLGKLCEKILAQQLTAFIWTASTEESAEINAMLWTYKDTSFIPHCLATAETAETTPIVLGHDEEHTQKKYGVLINLSHQMPKTLANFVRIIEIIDGSDLAKASGRERYRVYQALGTEQVELKMHRL